MVVATVGGHMRRRAYSDAVRDRFVEAVLGGGSVLGVARMLGVPLSTAQYWWQRAGVGTRLRMGRGGLVDPPSWSERDAGRYLSIADRAVIEAGVTAGLTLARIGVLIGRDKSVISRELARNRGADGVYRARVAERFAVARRARPKRSKLHANPRMRARVEAWMDDGWSPGLIAHMLAVDAGDDQTERVSHETIYRALYVQGRGGLRQDLAQKLSTGRTQRKARGGGSDHRGGASYREAFTISQRPPEAADRAVPGHWEGDLIMGRGNQSAIGTLVERSTRFVILLHLPGRHTADEVATAMIARMSELPDHLRRSITWDRGPELAHYEHIRLALKAPVYFADPHSPWQRGTNENTNRLLRFWFTKGTDLRIWSATDLRRVQDTLNRRPRPTLGYRTPAQALNDHLAPAPVATNP